jgi:hypothetical protein
LILKWRWLVAAFGANAIRPYDFVFVGAAPYSCPSFEMMSFAFSFEMPFVVVRVGGNHKGLPYDIRDDVYLCPRFDGVKNP